MKAIDSFRLNIARARELGQLYNSITAITTSVLNINDLLRAQIVMAVSALDHFVHEVVRAEMVAIYEKTRPLVPGFSKFSVSLAEAMASIPGPSSLWVDSVIRETHSYLSFQHPDKIADAIRLIYEPPLWQSVENRLGIPAKDIKEQLKLIVERRNKIAHEADIDPSFPGTRWPISYRDASSVTDFIEQLVEAINSEIV